MDAPRNANSTDAPLALVSLAAPPVHPCAATSVHAVAGEYCRRPSESSNEVVRAMVCAERRSEAMRRRGTRGRGASRRGRMGGTSGAVEVEENQLFCPVGESAQRLARWGREERERRGGQGKADEARPNEVRAADSRLLPRKRQRRQSRSSSSSSTASTGRPPLGPPPPAKDAPCPPQEPTSRRPCRPRSPPTAADSG